jgi:hypothetical protein
MATVTKNAKELGFKQITIAELQKPDFFSLDGKTFFIFSKVEEIGARLVSIHYLSTKKWSSYDRVIRNDKKVFVAPLGRHYEG